MLARIKNYFEEERFWLFIYNITNFKYIYAKILFVVYVYIIYN